MNKDTCTNKNTSVFGKISKTFALVFFMLFQSACSKLVKFRSATFGSDVNNGKITDRSLSFVFNDTRPDLTAERFFDYAYFQGDTLCFSFAFNKLSDSDRIRVLFICNGVVYPAERLETTKNRVWGFSLVGSLLAKFYAALSNQNISNLSFPLKTEMTINLDYSDASTDITKSFPVAFVVNK